MSAHHYVLMSPGSALQQDAAAAAEALARSETGVVEVLRRLHGRRAEEVEPAALAKVESQLRALIEVAAAVAAAHGLDDVLEYAAVQALSATGAASLAISRWEAATGTIRTLINVGDLAPGEERWPEAETYDVAEFPLWRDLFDGVPQISAVDDPASDPGMRALLARLGKETSIGVAIRFSGEVWGELWATTKPGAPRFNSDDVIFLQTIAEQLGAALGRAELFDRIAAMAYCDPLTGVANRRAVDDALARALEDPAGETTLLMCDLDGLKSINDELGHEAGDRMLERTGQALREAAVGWPDATVGRLGGDEFCVLLPTGGLDAARQVAERAQAELAAREPPAGISCGAASARGATPSALMRAADAAQYQAKHLGRGVFGPLQGDLAPVLPRRTAGPRRRSYRDRGALAREQLVSELLATLDGELARASVRERLARVAQRFAAALDGCSWVVGYRPAGGGLQTVAASGEAEPPLLASMADRAAGFTIAAADPRAPESERRALAARGLAAGAGVSTPAARGSWVTVIGVARPTLHLREVLPELRLLALAAVAGTGPATASPGRPA